MFLCNKASLVILAPLLLHISDMRYRQAAISGFTAAISQMTLLLLLIPAAVTLEYRVQWISPLTSSV